MDAATLNNLLVQIRYPGMPKVETDITRAWIRKHGADYDKLEFNVRLGQGQEIQAGIGEATALQYAKISRKRADIVATLHGRVDIIEVKPSMSFGGVGQLLGYLHLWEQTYPAIPVRRLVAIAQLIDHEVEQVLISHKVDYETIEPEALP